MDKYKGKLNCIYTNSIVQEYIKEGSVHGYLSHEDRTDNTDIILENIYAKSGVIYKEIISEWVCSKIARHFMDDCKTESHFKDNIIRDAKGSITRKEYVITKLYGCNRLISIHLFYF